MEETIYTPLIEDLLNFAQFTKTIEIPTAEGGTSITLSLLWEGELAQINRKSADYANPQDMLSRSTYIKLETLVYSIDKIGDIEYKSIDPEENKTLKNKLRMILQKCSPAIINYIYGCYSDLISHRDSFVESKTSDLKKKFQESLNGKIPEL